MARLQVNGTSCSSARWTWKLPFVTSPELWNAPQESNWQQLQWQQQLPPTCPTVASAPSASVSAKYCSNVPPLVVSRAQRRLDLSPLVIYSAYLGYCTLLLRAELFFASSSLVQSSRLAFQIPICAQSCWPISNLDLTFGVTLSQQGKATASARGVLSTPLLSPSSVFWNFLEYQTSYALWIFLLVNPSTHL